MSRQDPVAEAALDRAIAHHKAGRVAEAEAAYRAVLARAPRHIDALHLLGVLAHQSGRDEAALDLIGRALALDPDFPQAHNNIGLVFLARGRLAEAEAHGRAAIALNPAYADAHTNLGNTLKDRGRPEEAEACHRRALDLRPDYAEAMTNLGAVLELLGRSGEAARWHRRALGRRPDLADAHNNLGITLQNDGRRDEAEACFERTLALDSRFPLAHWNRGLLRLAKGDLDDGWSEYGWRFRGPQLLKNRHPRVAEWQGETLAGKRLLVWREQGVGDELMFASIYPDLIRHAAGQGGHVVIECEPRLVPLFARSFVGATVRAETGGAAGESIDPPDVDVHLPAGTLPRFFRRRLEDFPSRPDWLVADPDRVAHWRERLAGTGTGLKVGLCWRSRDLTVRRAASYTGLRQWEPLLAMPGVAVIGLQYDECRAEIADAERRFGVTVHQWPDLDLKDDFEATAALIAGLDLVITGPTSVGELAGALGVPVWRMAWAGDWSALGAAARPWFPAMRLFYGPADGTLADQIAAMMARLDSLRLDSGRADTLRTAPPPTRPAPAPAPAPELAPALVPDTMLEAAIGHHRAGRLNEAEPLYRLVLDREPGQPVALHLLGLLAHQTGRLAEAATLIGRAVALAPEYAAAHVNLGNVLQAQGRWPEAVAHYGRALALDPAAPATLTNLGNALEKLGRLDAAAEAHGRALALRPDFVEAHVNLGTVLAGQDQLAAAEASYRRALVLDPGTVAAHAGLGVVLRRQERFDEAAASLLQALAFDANDAAAFSDLGFVRQHQGDLAMAEACFHHALSLDPHLASAHLNLGLLRLRLGRLEEGWAGYAWRFAANRRAVARIVDRPEWQGEDLAGKRLLVWREQGVGDELMFASTYPDLIRRVAGQGGQVVIECEPRLFSLFTRSFAGATVRPAGWGDGSDVDVQVAAGTLPRLLRPGLAAFPERDGWLTADPDRVAAWHGRLAALGGGLKIGIAWRSGLLDGGRALSYTGLRQWAPLFAVDGVRFITLQYGEAETEILDAERRFGTVLHRWPDLDLKDDFEGTAALITTLDLVISGPTAVSELAGALGRPVWRLSWKGDWSALGTARRPWFPTMRTVLAGDGENLDDMLARIAAGLAGAERLSSHG